MNPIDSGLSVLLIVFGIPLGLLAVGLLIMIAAGGAVSAVALVSGLFTVAVDPIVKAIVPPKDPKD